jgi:FAD/FMN-containing dehydrogenase
VVAPWAAFLAALPPGVASDDPADLAPHLVDWRGLKTGHADLLLRPRATAEVVAIVQAAARHGVALVPQGGNTGLVGGSVPEARPARPTALVSTRRLRAIGPADREALSITVEAGAVLADVRAAAEAAACRFPLWLGAGGTATIGGLVSTNAGGTEVLRHGTMRRLVLGLEAVLPDGTLLDSLAPLRKDSSGYDVKQLLIGAEGTLGIVTRVALALAPAPAATATGWVGLASPAAALRLLGRLRTAAGETVESFELIGAAALDCVTGAFPDQPAPLAGRHDFHVLVEMAAVPGTLEALLGAALEAGEAEDAVVARSLAQSRRLWALREAIPLAEKREGAALKNDVAVPVEGVPGFHAEAEAALAAGFPGIRPLVFGHLGDGNLHWNIRPPQGDTGWLAREGEAARALLHDIVRSHGGTISAEHGIGTLKAAELARLGDRGRLAAMRAIKAALDPAGLMNPGKIFV